MPWKSLLFPKAFWKTLRSLARREDGSVAVEMAFCSMVFVTLITGMISFGAANFVQGNMSDAARDTVRRLALGDLTAADAPTYVQSQLVNWGMDFTINATNNGTNATVEITVPAAQAAIIDFLGLFNGSLRASVSMPVES